MKDTTLVLWIAGLFLALVLTALIWSDAFTAESSFTVNDPAHGLINMHPELVKEEP